MTGPRPPAVALRPLGAAELLDGAVRLVRRNARASFTLSVPFAVVWAALSAGADDVRRTLGSGLSVLVDLAIPLAVGTVLTGLLAPVFAGDVLGERVTAGAALRQVGRRWWPLVVLVVVVTVSETVGLVLLVVGGVWLWGVWAVAAPALVVERTGIRQALGRSLQLVRTLFWRTWGLRALGYALVYVLTAFLRLPFLVLAGALTNLNPFDAAKGFNVSGTYLALIAVGTLISVAVTAPITSAVEVLLYLDLRMRREGLDIATGPPAPQAPTQGAPVTAW